MLNLPYRRLLRFYDGSQRSSFNLDAFSWRSDEFQHSEKYAAALLSPIKRLITLILWHRSFAFNHWEGFCAINQTFLHSISAYTRCLVFNPLAYWQLTQKTFSPRHGFWDWNVCTFWHFECCSLMNMIVTPCWRSSLDAFMRRKVLPVLESARRRKEIHQTEFHSAMRILEAVFSSSLQLALWRDVKLEQFNFAFCSINKHSIQGLKMNSWDSCCLEHSRKFSSLIVNSGFRSIWSICGAWKQLHRVVAVCGSPRRKREGRICSFVTSSFLLLLAFYEPHLNTTNDCNLAGIVSFTLHQI